MKHIPKLTNSQQYFREIELHWSLQRGNQIIVSPLEFDAVMEWFEKPVPINVVLRAIDRFLERKKKNKRRRSHLLSHVSGDVAKLNKEYNLLHIGSFDSTTDVGESAETGTFDLITGKLKTLTRKIRSLERESLACIELKLKELLSEERMKTFLCYEDLEVTLQSIDQQMISLIEEECTPEQRQLIKDELKEFLDEEKDGEFFQKAYNDLLRVNFNLPRITVLG